MNVEELVRRLRDAAKFTLGESYYGQAADKLEELAAHSRLQAEDIMTLGQMVGKAESALAEAKRENEALREALSKIIAKDSYIDASPRGGRKVSYGDFAKIARNAGGKDEKD